MTHALTYGLICIAASGALASGALAQSKMSAVSTGTATGDSANYDGIQSRDFQQVTVAREFVRAGQEQKALVLLNPLQMQGFAPAMTLLGSMYAAGRGVDRDDVRAADLYAKAASAGDAQAMYLFGYALDNGIGVAQDRDMAMMWMQRASDSGKIDLQKAVRAYRERMTG